MVTVPAHSFCDPTRWCVIAAARFMPGVCGVFMSSAWAGMTTTPCVRQSGWLPGSVVIVVEDRRPADDLRAGRWMGASRIRIIARAQTGAREAPRGRQPGPGATDSATTWRRRRPRGAAIVGAYAGSGRRRRTARHYDARAGQESHFVDGGRFDQSVFRAESRRQDDGPDVMKANRLERCVHE
jgi:hypothetical protein